MRTRSSPRPLWSRLPPLRSIAPACLCFLTLAVLVASPIFAQAQATDLTPAAKLELGLSYKAAKDYAKAMPLFAEVAASQDSRKAQAMFYIEDCYCEQGRISDAVVELTKAYNECPDARAEVLLRRAARLCDIQKYKEGLADYQEFLTKYPEKTDIIAAFSTRLPEIKLRATGPFDGPAAALETEWNNAKNANADSAYIKLVGLRLAEVCLRDRVWSKGLDVHTALIQDYPDETARLKMGLGLCQKGLKQYDKAIQTFTDIAANDKSRAVEALFFVEDCLSEQHKDPDCIGHLTKMLAEYPEARAEILMRRAARLGDAGKPAEGLADLLEVQANFPERKAEAVLGEGLMRLELAKKTGDETELSKATSMLYAYPKQYPAEPVFAAASQFHLGIFYIYQGRGVRDKALCNNPAIGRSILETAAMELPETIYTWWMNVEAASSYLSQLHCAEAVAAIDQLLVKAPPPHWEEYLLYLKWSSLVRQMKTQEAEAVVDLLTRNYPTGQWTKVAQEKMPVYKSLGGRQ